MKLYRRLFLRAGLPFAIIMALVLTLSHGFVAGCIYGLLAGIAFGLLMSIMLGSLHIAAVRRISGGDIDITAVNHSGTALVAHPPEAALELCAAAVGTLKGGEILSQNEAGGILEARSGKTWKSFGERITFTLADRGDGITEVAFASRPAAGTTVVDYGKNLQNVRQIAIFLAQHA